MGAAHEVLVVDDDQSLRLLCRVNLELDGHTVNEAATLDGARAVLSERADRVELVLLDVHVGAENGLTLLNELERDRPELPVVLLTGESGLPPDARGNARHVLSKPFDISELSRMVERLTTRARP
jgi:DNA-binding NtrC family response regulator